eukprot:scaffold73858_cov27-Tisochrysis_lutea.AAC.1
MDRCCHPRVSHVWAQAHCVVYVSEPATFNSCLPFFPVCVMVWRSSRTFSVLLAVLHAVEVASDQCRGRV